MNENRPRIFMSALMALMMLMALCSLTACTPVDLDELARLQTLAITDSIREAGMDSPVGDRGEALYALVRARLEEAKAARENRFIIPLTVSVLSGFQPDWDAVHRRLAAFDPSDLQAMRQSYENALNDSLAAGEGATEQTECPLTFVVTKAEGGEWRAEEANRFAALKPYRVPITHGLVRQAASRPGPGADAVTEALLPSVRTFMAAEGLLGSLTQSYPMRMTVEDFSPLLVPERGAVVEADVRFEIPALDGLGQEAVRAMLEPYLSTEYPYGGESAFRQELERQVLGRLKEGFVRETLPCGMTLALSWDGKAWLPAHTGAETRVRAGLEEYAFWELDTKITERVKAAMGSYYAGKAHAATRPWATAETLQALYGAVERDGMPDYAPAAPQPGCVLLVADQEYGNLDTERRSLEQAFAGQITFVSDPDQASSILLYTQEHALRTGYSGNIEVYASILRLRARSVTGGYADVPEVSQTNNPARTIQVRAGAKAYYTPMPNVNGIDGLSGFVRELLDRESTLDLGRMLAFYPLYLLTVQTRPNPDGGQAVTIQYPAFQPLLEGAVSDYLERVYWKGDFGGEYAFGSDQILQYAAGNADASAFPCDTLSYTLLDGKVTDGEDPAAFSESAFQAMRPFSRAVEEGPHAVRAYVEGEALPPEEDYRLRQFQDALERASLSNETAGHLLTAFARANATGALDPAVMARGMGAIGEADMARAYYAAENAMSVESEWIPLIQWIRKNLPPEEPLAARVEKVRAQKAGPEGVPFWSMNDLRAYYDITLEEGRPLYRPQNPVPGHILLVGTPAHNTINSLRHQLEGLFDGTFVLTADPDQAACVMVYTAIYDYAGSFDVFSPVVKGNAYATTGRLEAFLPGDPGGTTVTLSTEQNHPGGSVSVGINQTAYYAPLPDFSDEALTGFIKELTEMMTR